MHKVSAEGTTFYYYPNKDQNYVLTDLVPIVSNVWQLEFQEIYKGEDVKLVLFPDPLDKQKWLIYWLFWSHENIIHDLDEKIESDQYSDEDFKYSVKTLYQETICSNCDSRWQTLVIPPGDPYPGNIDLMEKKLKFFKILTCPNCGSRLRQMVVKIIK